MAKKKQAVNQNFTMEDVLRAGYRIRAEPEITEVVAPEPEPTRGLLRGAADLGLEAASGAAKGIKFMSDVFGADNPVSQGLQGVSDFAKELQSAQAKGEDQRIAQLMKEAEDKGIGEQVKAALRAAGEAPVRQAIGAIGTSVPMIAASMVPGLREASWGTRAAALGGMGGAQGVGVVKSSMYDSVYQRAIEEGRSEQEARALAQQAQAYSPENAGDIALGGGLGGLAALTGFEPAAARAVGGAAAKSAAAKTAQRGLMQSTLRGTLAETIPEATQGFQEQVAGNRAEQRAGFDTPTFRGAAGSATLEGLLSAPGGAVGGMLDARGAKPAPKLLADQIRATESVPETGPMTRAANQAVEAKAQQVEMTAGAESAALASMEKQAQDDLKGLRDFAGRSPDVVAGMPMSGAQPTETSVDPSAEFIDSPFLDRIQTVQEMLADPATREKVRARWGDEGLNNIAYYAGMANRTGLPEKTQENLLGMAERLLSESVLTPIQPAPELGGMRRDPLTLGNQPQPAAPALGMDGTPSGRFTVDPQGNVAPESRVQAMEAQRRAEEAASLGKQTPRGQAQPETTMQGTLGIGMDTAPTGRLLAGQDGVRPETRMDAINIGQADMQRQADAAQRAEVGLTPDIEAVQQRNAMRPQDGDILNPSGKPFKTLMAAQRAAKKSPGEIVEVTGGFAIRPATMVAAQPEVANDGRGNQAAAGLAEALAGSNPKAGDRATAGASAVAPGEMLDALPGQPAGAQPAQGNAGQGQRVGREGYDTPVELDAASLKAIIEKTRGEPLATKPAKLEAWRNGTAKTDPAKYPIELAFTTDGRLDVNDGRHRIALAAERGEKVTAFIDGKDARRAQELLANVQNLPQPTPAKAPADQAPEAARGDGAAPARVPEQGGAAAAVEAAGVDQQQLDANAAPANESKKPGREEIEAEVVRQVSDAWSKQTSGGFVVNKHYPAVVQVNGRERKLGLFKRKGDGTLYAEALEQTVYGPSFTQFKVTKDGKLEKVGDRNLYGRDRAVADQAIAEFNSLFDGREKATSGQQTSTIPSRADLAARAPLPKGDPEQAAREQAEMDGINALAGVAPINVAATTDETASAKQALRDATQQVERVNAEWSKLYRDGQAYFTGDGPKRKLVDGAPQDIAERFSAYKRDKKAAQKAYEDAAARLAGLTPQSQPKAPEPVAANPVAAQEAQTKKARQPNGSDTEKAKALFAKPVPESNQTSAITADDVAAAEKQAAQMISGRIDAMTAQAAQKVAARYLPTVGIKVPVGKARIKAAMTDAVAMNLMGPAGELGIELSDSIKRALTAKMEGRVGEVAAPVAAKTEQQKPQAEQQRTEYPFGRVANDEEDRFFQSRVRVLPDMKGDTAWEGEVGLVLNGGRLLEVKRDGRDFRVRIPGDRIEVLDLKDSKSTETRAVTPIDRFEELRANGTDPDSLQNGLAALRKVAGRAGESTADFASRYIGEMGSQKIGTASGKEVLAWMEGTLIRKAWDDQSIPGANVKSISRQATAAYWRDQLDRYERDAKSFNDFLAKMDQRTFDVESMGGGAERIAQAREAIQEMNRKADQNKRELDAGLKAAEAREQAEKDQEEAESNAKFKPADLKDLEKKPTPASITGWSNAVYQGDPAWTNGHLVDLVSEPHLSGWQDRMNALRKDAPPLDAGRVVPKSQGTPLKLVGIYDNGNSTAPVSTVYLESNGRLTALNRNYYRYFASKFKGAEFQSHGETQPVTVHLDGRMVGLLMPINLGRDGIKLEEVKAKVAANLKREQESAKDAAAAEFDAQAQQPAIAPDVAPQPASQEQPATPKIHRRDPTKTNLANPYEVGDTVTIAGQDWTVGNDTSGWYLTTTGNWRGAHPTIRNIKAMTDLINEVEQAATALPQKPSGQKYTSPADVSTRAGQMELANRAGTIAALKGMNAQLRAIAPDEAWADANIEEATDLDALRTAISEALVKAQRAGQGQPNDALRKRLEEASGEDLKAVFGVLNLAGARMSHSERVNALLAEDAQAVSDALDQVLANTPKLTQAEAAQLMEWQDMGQKEGVKTHALMFYENQANKDAKVGRMTMATVSKGDVSDKAWTVDGDDQKFGMLAQAKRRAMEIGMARAVKDGFVEAAEGRAIADTRNDKPASDSLNKPHTIDKKRVLTPSGAISAGARNSDADSSIWYHQGDIKMLAMTASVKVDGQLSKGADEAKRIVKAVSTAQKAGWALRNYRAGTLGTVWTLEKGDQFLTRAGLENIDAEQIKDPQIPDYGPGWDNMVRGQKDLAKALFSWLSTLPAEQRENQATVSRKMADVLGGWAYIERDKLGLHVRYKPAEKPEGNRVSGAQWTHTIPIATDWSHALQIIAEMAEGSFDAQPAAEAATNAATSTTPATDAHNTIMSAVREGKATPEQFKDGFEAVVTGKAAIMAELDAKTKVQLLREGGPYMQMRYASEKKADVVEAMYRQMLGEYALGESVTFGMGKDSYQNAVRRLVDATDADKLARFVQEQKAAKQEAKARIAAKAAAIQNPQTLEDYREVVRSKVREGMTTKEAFLSLTPEQRIRFDTLAAESTRDEREARKRAMKTRVSAASQTTGGQVIATKHTRDGYDLFVVQLADRLSAEDYKTVLASAKKLGGWYSSFRGNGATPGFQFKDRASADAFLALAGGDKTAAQNQVEQRRDAFEDDRGQTAVERLRAMADKLEEQASEEEGRDRKANTARRARFASAALAAAAAEKAKANTMRNIAQAIEDGKAKFLDEVRTKSQVDMLTSIVETAKANELRAKYPSYADQEKRKGEPPTAETADFADFPSFSAFRSDLAILGRQLLEVDGAKKLGQRLMSVADDVTDAYLEFAKGNLSKVSQFGRGDTLADFGNQQEAERAIKRSGLTGKAIVLQVKRGQNRVILSPSEAIGRGIWAGDGDKRITLTVEFGNELVEAIGRRGNKSNRLTVPWQFQNAYDRRKALSRIGIETASEFRSALREFIDLKEQATANRVRELELQMVGRQKDGLDFFPTAAEVADQMVEAADLSPDMAVLEPSAGMGHLADRIREAGAEPDVIELSPDRRELLEEKGYHLAEVDDFMAMEPRKFFTYGDVFRAPDGTEGIMRGVGHMGSQRVRLEDEAGNRLGLYDRSDLVGVRHRGTWSGYDRIIMNPPFSNRRDAEHVRHAYDLLKPGGRIVAIMGEGVFFGQDQKAVDFRDWLESVGGTSEKLPEGSFMDPSLPVNTSVNARMVVIDKPQLPGGEVQFSRAPRSPNGLTATETQSIADAIAERWANAPEIVVAADMNDAAIPQAVRDYDTQQRSLGAKGDPEGFWYDGKVYLVAKSMASPSDVMRVLFHESLGHYGLRGVFGKALDPILNQIAAMRRADVQAKADEYGLDLNKPGERLQAAEEVLSVMAQTKPELGYVKRAIAAIRSWMRRTFPKLFGQMKLTDAEIIRDFILPARGWVEGGPGGGPKGGLPAMSRSQELVAAEDAIRFSRTAAAKAYVAPAMDKLNETFNHPGKLSWWHKTVGSMYNLAERMPAFKPVYDAAQNFINDVSFYAIEAADKAPKLLPRLEDWKDLAKSPITAQDNKAVAAPVFEGTLSWRRDESGKPVLVEDLAKRYASLTPEQKAQRLLRANAISENVLKMWQGMPKDQYASSVNTAFEGRMLKAGIVFTPDELKSIFKLNDAQVALYQEFRQSIDTSLDNMGKSDLLRVAGKDAADLRDAVMSAPDVDAAAVLLRDHLLELAKEDPDRSDALVTTANDMITRAEKVQRLKMEGYAPLSRFGQYTVDVVVDGERQYFSMFETARDANRMAAKLKMEYGAENVAQGTLSQREFEMLQGITPESLELFGNMLGLDSTGNEAQDQVFQEYLKRTKANRSAMKRLIHRKGIAGYSEDVGRVLAAFVYSNARQTSAALHMGDLGEAVMAIPKGEGELKDAAVELARYVKEPREEAAKMRGWLFAQYLGGSIASAIVNFTQPLTTSAPYLSQFGGMGKSVKALYQAMADLKDKKFEAGLAESFRKRTEDGTLAPQGVHELMAQSRGEATLRTGDGTQVGDALAKGRNAVAKAMIGWGKLFGMAEQINRQSTYVAAYRMAVERGMADPDAFAKKAVDETQFVNNKANKMKFGRGAIGATLMTFKSYSLNWLELFHRLATQNGREGKMAAAWMVGVLLLSAGASGLPFAEDAEDLADFLAQRLGYNWSSKKARQEFLESLFGRDIAGFVENGVTGLPGAPIDVSGRLGMGNMIPGTGLFLSKKDHTSDFTEVLGPAGDLAKRTFQAGDLLLSGNVGQAALMIAPKAIGNLEKGVDMAATGMYRDARGYKVDDATTSEAIGKAIGFQPRAVAQIQEASGLNQRAKDFYRLKVERINAKWAEAIFEKDAATVDEVRAEIKEWNRQNPDQRIQANIPAILRRVKEMRKTKAERIADTAPKALRASMREEVRRMQEEQGR